MKMKNGAVFDAVLMLTWSDWKTEPRSNRYHYATRFARELPVLFVQTAYGVPNPLSVEKSGHPGIDLVHYDIGHPAEATEALMQLLDERGIRRPLLWIYNYLHYESVLKELSGQLTVLHATEDYLTPSRAFQLDQTILRGALDRTLRQTDMIVCVSQGVASAYRELGGYSGPQMVADNGCDARHLLTVAAVVAAAGPPASRVVLFQGGINSRLDFALLHQLVGRMPDWTFRFCGRTDDAPPEWATLLSKPNVEYLGRLDADGVARAMSNATVGIIPFIQDDWIRNSLPLKSYEYVAMGLPVVTVPIDGLAGRPDLFRFACTANEFAAAIVEVAPSRTAAEALARRREAALANSYDERFERVKEEVIRERARVASRARQLNVAILYDDQPPTVNAVREHLESFSRNSRHRFYYIPAAAGWGRDPRSFAAGVDLGVYDALIVHFGVRLSLPRYLSDQIARQIERFRGPKLLFIQDEYESTEIARRWMDRLRFDVVFTCVPQDMVHLVYPRDRYPGVEFITTLTGYVPESINLDAFVRPMRERRLLIGYRGRMLSPIYGELGHDKYRIGVEMKRLAQERGLEVDIEVDDGLRLYGADWYRFLGSVRATLGTESGSNVFDVDGSIRKAIEAELARDPSVSYERLHARHLAKVDGAIRMNQVSPKIFEAIRLGTALVLFEGSYSNVVRPHVHYIPLRKDLSNVDEVFERLQDVEGLEAMTARAYSDVIASGRFSYRSFVADVDSVIDRHVTNGPRYQIFSVPLWGRDQLGETTWLWDTSPNVLTVADRPLADGIRSEDVVSQYSALVQPPVPAAPASVSDSPVADPPPRDPAALRVIRALWRMLLPATARHWVLSRVAALRTTYLSER